MKKMEKKEFGGSKALGEDPRLRYVTQNNLPHNGTGGASSMAISTDLIQSISRVVGYAAHQKNSVNSNNISNSSSSSGIDVISALSPFIFEARHNSDWAINSYFLAQLRKEDELRQRFDDNIKSFTLQHQRLQKRINNDSNNNNDERGDVAMPKRSYPASTDRGGDDEVEEQSAFQRLPYDVVWRVFELLEDESDLLRTARVSKFFRSIAESNLLWKRLFRIRFGSLRFDPPSSVTVTPTSSTISSWLYSSASSDRTSPYSSSSTSSSSAAIPDALYESPPNGFWRELFREKKRREILRHVRKCSRCHCLGGCVSFSFITVVMALDEITN